MDNLRAPICGIFGHVDSGKTSFLSKLKSFETIEAGGITQGINSIFVSIDKIKSVCEKINETNIKIPGILFVDTPGHEAFHNFRSKASDICDMAIVIIDIEKNVEKQTISSLTLLQSKKIPFIIVLTKLDKIQDWVCVESSDLKKSLKNQSTNTITMLNVQIEDIKYELTKHSINSEFYFKNKTPGKTYSIIPVSNKSGEGFNDMVNFMIYIIQNFMNKKLALSPKPKMFVMEKYFDKNLGWTAQVILTNGIVNAGDNILINTPSGPVKSVIRNMIGLDPVKNKWAYQPTVTASNAITLFAPNLEHVIVGSHIYTWVDDNEYQTIISEFASSNPLHTFIDSIKTDVDGHYLLTQTDSEFEAGYEVFKSNGITISNGSCGPLTEKTIDQFYTELTQPKYQKITTLDEFRIMIYYSSNQPKNYTELVKYAKKKSINIIWNNVIYNLVDELNTLKTQLINTRKNQMKKDGLIQMPLELKLLKQHIYMKGGNSNILCGFKIIGGCANIGTEIICVNTETKQTNILGQIIKIEKNHKEITLAIKNDEVCIRLNNPGKLTYQKHWSENDLFFSNITRPKLEILKRDFRTDICKEDWLLVRYMVDILKI